METDVRNRPFQTQGTRNMTRRICALALFATTLTTAVVLALPSQPADPVLSASLNGVAYDVQLDSGTASAVAVATKRPVLTYRGRSANGRYLAYSPLDAFDDTSPLNRRAATALDIGKNELVPTGDLLIEGTRFHSVRQVNLSGHYVLEFAWSPVDPDRLVYTFSAGSEFGVAVANVRTRQVEIIRERGILPDYVAWTASGIELFEADGTFSTAEEGYEVEHFRPVVIADTSQELSPIAAPARSLPRPAERLFEPQALIIDVGEHTLYGDSLGGSSEMELRSPTGAVISTFKSPVIEAVSEVGVLLRAIDDLAGSETLFFVGRDGGVTTIMTTSPISTVNYYLPYSSRTSLRVTQGGSAYSPSCGLYDHYGRLSYAYDLQSELGQSTAVLAAASGTVAYFRGNISCNSLDRSGCSDYKTDCSGITSYYGWGNVVVIQHADSRWTSYSHLRYGTVKPTRTGVSVTRGCKLGNQGHTGATVGERNGCGDHLHIQRQTGVNVTNTSTSSTSLTWSGLSNPLSCSRTYTATLDYRLCF